MRSRWGGLALPRLPRMSSRSQERLGPETRSRSRDLRNKISFWKRKSASITDYDPQYRVIYLGNVLTGWAKGELTIVHEIFSKCSLNPENPRRKSFSLSLV